MSGRAYLRAWRGTVLLIALAGVVALYLRHEYLADRRLEPPTTNCTVAELAEKTSPPQRLAVITQNGVQRLIWIGHIPPLTIRSGPPCHVFDEGGRLVDWCSDTGEGWPGQHLVGAAFQAHPISLDEALRLFAKGSGDSDSYEHPTVGSGSIVNDLAFIYDDFGQLVSEYREHPGAVNTSTSLKVQYAYEDGTDNNVRLTKMTYPDGRELNYDYGSSGSTADNARKCRSCGCDGRCCHNPIDIPRIRGSGRDLENRLLDLASSVYGSLDRSVTQAAAPLETCCCRS